jgi:hypothetical protein
MRCFVIVLPRLAATALLLTLPVLAQTFPAVTTRAFTNDRAGANLNEKILTPNVLLTKGLARKTTIPVVGDARGTECQPLILPAVKLPDGTTHDIMVLPSMANVVRGVDAHTGAAIWQTPALGRPVDGGAAIDFHLINDKWGVLSTGVIDPATKLVYLVAWISPDGTPANGVHFIYTLDVATGNQVKPPVSLAGLSNGTQTYSATMRKQRSSLVMTNVNGRKTVFFAYGTVQETGRNAAGAIIAFDVVSSTITAFLPMSEGIGAGIWMGGQGVAADSDGFLYGVTGNGSFNGVNDFGETIFKAQYTPPAAGSAKGSLAIVDHWSPYSDAGRVGKDPTQSGPAPPITAKLAGESSPSEEMAAMPVGGSMSANLRGARVVTSFDQNTGAAVPLVYPADPRDAAWNDEDLGSAGCTLIAKSAARPTQKTGLLLCSGKDGIGYVLNTSNMGNTMPADFANAKANCAKLAAPPVWLTASPGPVDPCPQDTTTLNFMPWGKTRHLHMTPVQYQSPTRGMTIFVWGENSQLHAWSMSATGALKYLAQSDELASIESFNSPGGMPGGFCSLSSNNNTLGTAIVWCSIPYGDGNARITNGRLIAYDAENFITNTANGNKSLKVLWDSQRFGIPYIFNKFMPPTVWDGQVYLPNYNGGVDVYGIP